MGLFGKKNREVEMNQVVYEPQESITYIKHGVDYMKSSMERYMADEVKLSDCMDSISKCTDVTKEDLSGMKEVIDGIQEGYSHLEEYADSISNCMNRSDEKIEQANENVMSLSSQIEESKNQLNDVTTTFTQLENDFDNIKELTASITGISSRTNLLALNASIEAARAGEAGKGFAVVAEQIRELSASTAELVGGIENTIKSLFTTLESLQKEIRETADNIQSNIDQVGGLKTSFDEVKICTDETRHVGQQITNAISSASKELNECNNRSNQIMDAVDNIDDEVDKLKKMSSEKSTVLSEVVDLLQQLNVALSE